MEKITILGEEFREGDIVIITQKPGATYGTPRAPELIGRLHISGKLYKIFNHDIEVRPCDVSYGLHTLHLRSKDILLISKLYPAPKSPFQEEHTQDITGA